MIIDDELDIHSVIKRGLESENEFRVDTFSRAEDAINQFQNQPRRYYDLIITDIRMPEMNGFELNRQIEKNDPNMKIAFITAFEINKEEFSKVIPSVDVTHFIMKPISIQKLRAKIRTILQGNDTYKT